MRKLVLILPAVLCLPLLARAQQQPPTTPYNGQPAALPPLGTPPAGVPPLGQRGASDPLPGQAKTAPVAAPRDERSAESEKRLNEILDGWQKRLRTMDAFYSRVELKEMNALTRREKVWEGQLAFMKPNLAKINLEEQGQNPQNKTGDFQRFICTDKLFYVYSAKEKKIRTYEIPQGNQGGGNMIVDMLRGMSTTALRQRFDMKLEKEDKWYAYVDITPKYASDQQDFLKAQLVLWMQNPLVDPKDPQKKNPKIDLTLLPCRIHIIQPNKNEATYSFPFDKMIPNAPVNRQWFAPTKPLTKDGKPDPEWEIIAPSTTPPAPVPAGPPKK